MLKLLHNFDTSLLLSAPLSQILVSFCVTEKLTSLHLRGGRLCWYFSLSIMRTNTLITLFPTNLERSMQHCLQHLFNSGR